MNIIPPQVRRKSKCKCENIEKCNLFLLFSNQSCRSEPRYVKAIYENGITSVINTDEINYLWKNGYYGEGSFSKCGIQHISENNSYEDKKVGDKCDKEVLRLSSEEALFLAYGLGVLIVTDENGQEINIDQLWSIYCKVDFCFPFLYTVYHHYRSKGWVVKSGLKFGADYMLYPGGPTHYHSQFLVWIQCLWEDTLENDSTFPGRKSSLENISAFERLSNQTSKNALVCQLLRPPKLSENDLKHINCVKEFTISEIILRRWNVQVDSCGQGTSKQLNEDV